MAKAAKIKVHTDLKEFLDDMARRRPYAQAVAAAWRTGSIAAVEAAQKAFREAFPNG